MAQIPQYQPQQESPRPLPTPYDETKVSPDAFGAQGGEVLQQAAGVASDFAKKAKADADAARVVQAEAQLGDDYNTAIYDPKAGFVTRRGNDAMAAYQGTVQRLKDSRKKILESLANDDQKQAFLARSGETLLQAMHQVEAHTYQQGEQANSDAFRAREAVSYNTLANTALNRFGRESEMDQMRTVIVANAQRTGASTDVLKAALQGYEQKAHATILDQMLAAQLATPAQEYFQQNKRALGSLADDYEKRVREVSVAQKGDFYARALVADPKNRVDGTLLPDPTKIVAAVGQLKEPIEVKDAALARALHQANLVTEAQDKRNSAVFGRALSDIDTVGIVNPNDHGLPVERQERRREVLRHAPADAAAQRGAGHPRAADRRAGSRFRQGAARHRRRPARILGDAELRADGRDLRGAGDARAARAARAGPRRRRTSGPTSRTAPTAARRSRCRSRTGW
jgi:hypothetical protein